MRVLPMSHIPIVVGMVSVRVPNNVPDLSNARRLVPVFVSVEVAFELEAGGHMDCDACMNSRLNPPF